MKILIIGATGFVGQQLVRRLHKKGHEMTCLVRNPKKAKKTLGHLCSFYEWNYRNPPPHQALQQVSHVINLAGESIVDKRWTRKRKDILRNSRVELTKKLVKSLESYPLVQILINASAIGFYADQGEQILHEKYPVHSNDFLSRLCVEWEKAALDFKNGRVVIFRFGHVLSPEGGILKKFIQFFKWGVSACMGDGKQWMSWIHIEDLLSMIEQALENENLEGVFNATSPHPMRAQEFSESLARVYEQDYIYHVPKFFLKIFVGEMSDILTSSARVLPHRFQREGFIFKYPSIKEVEATKFEKPQSLKVTQ